MTCDSDFQLKLTCEHSRSYLLLKSRCSCSYQGRRPSANRSGSSGSGASCSRLSQSSHDWRFKHDWLTGFNSEHDGIFVVYIAWCLGFCSEPRTANPRHKERQLRSVVFLFNFKFKSLYLRTLERERAASCGDLPTATTTTASVNEVPPHRNSQYCSPSCVAQTAQKSAVLAPNKGSKRFSFSLQLQ